MGYKVILSPSLSNAQEKRYVIVDNETGKILDDAQGYGYKTFQKAYASWGYKNQSKEKKSKREKTKREIKKWIEQHEKLMSDMDDCAVHILKGSYDSDVKIDVAFIREFFEKYNIEEKSLPFTLREFLKEYR